MLDSDEDGGDGFVAGAIVILLALALVVGLVLLRRDAPGRPPREALRSRLQKGVISMEQVAEAEKLLRLNEANAPDSLDAALHDLYHRRSSGDISDAEFWRARDAIGR